MNCLAKAKMKFSLDHPKQSQIDSVKADLKLFKEKNPRGSMTLTKHDQSSIINYK